MVKTFLVSAALLAASTALGQDPQPYPPPQPSSQSTAGSQGQSSTAQPSSPGASSQQVVVNPPPSQQPSTQPPAPPPAPPSSTTVVNPPPGYYPDDTVVVQRRDEHNPMATVATDAAYGGIAGLLVGFGVALVNEFDTWERDVMVGAGAGVLVGAAVGVAHAAYDAREDRRSRRVALDGMNRTDKDPVVTARTPVALAFRF